MHLSGVCAPIRCTYTLFIQAKGFAFSCFILTSAFKSPGKGPPVLWLLQIFTVFAAAAAAAAAAFTVAAFAAAAATAAAAARTTQMLHNKVKHVRSEGLWFRV